MRAGDCIRPRPRLGPLSPSPSGAGVQAYHAMRWVLRPVKEHPASWSPPEPPPAPVTAQATFSRDLVQSQVSDCARSWL